MKERQFAGMLNSKSVYGQSWGDSIYFRLCKYDKVQATRKRWSGLWIKWNKHTKFHRPSWAKSLYNSFGDVEWTQRHNNQGRKNKKIELFRWRKHG